MFDFPDKIQFEVGKYVENFIQWIVDNLGFIFDGISTALLWILVNIEDFLLWIPWWSVVLVVFILGFRIISFSSGITFAIMLTLIGSFGYWDQMMSTLAVVLGSVLTSVIIGVPIGIFMAYSNKMTRIVTPILDAMQTMPSFVYLIPALLLFGMGKVPAVFATLIYAIPPVIRLTNLAIRNVSKEMVEAAKSFGSSRTQMLVKVQIPQAMPTIMTGVNQTTMMALAMVVIASMIGAKGLGMEVLIAINRIDLARGFEAGLGIVFLAIIIDRLTQGIANRFKVSQN
jgi:glycine betaine/proline transport system permease protein